MISSWEILPFTDLDLQNPIFEKISRSTPVPDMTPEPSSVVCRIHAEFNLPA